jgi:hypothetical protein
MPRGEILLKLWNDWSAGVGHLRDDFRTPGMYNASGILGGVNELRAAQFINDVDFSAQSTATDMAATYFFDESISATGSVLYAVLNRIGANAGEIVKIRMDQANFGTAVTTDTAERNSTVPFGRPARYQGAWYIPATDDIHKVSGFSISADDTWANGETGGTHLAMINHQLSQYTTSSGARILAEDGAPTTGTWGSFFQVGDKDEPAVDMFAISGLMFVLKKSGLYSFGTKNGRTISGMVLEDFGKWRSSFDNLPSTLWKGGAVICHPSGLLYYTPGEAYTPIGFEAKRELEGIVPSGVTELEIGRYHGVTAAGDYLYTVYQPDPNSTAAVILSGFAPGAFPSNISWQVLGGITLAGNADDGVHGIHATALGFPENSGERNPVLWFTNAATGTQNLGYAILDSRGQPLRGRANTHKVVTSGNAWMSEVYFNDPQEIKRVVVYTEDMASGDEWQISAVYNGTGKDSKIGKPIISSGRHERPVMRRDIYRLTLHVNFVGTDATSRVPPSIKRIELWGPERTR